MPTVPIKFRALDGADIGPDPMEVDPATLSVPHTTTLSRSNEGGLPFWDYKRRRGTDKSSTEVVGGDQTKKRRRLIRPSLELGGQVSMVLKGSIPNGKSIRDHDNQVSDSAIFSDYQTDQLAEDERPGPVLNPDEIIDQIIAEMIDEFTDEKMDEIFNNSTFEAEKGPLLMSQNPICRYHPSYPLDSVFPRRTMELWHDIKV